MSTNRVVGGIELAECSASPSIAIAVVEKVEAVASEAGEHVIPTADELLGGDTDVASLLVDGVFSGAS